MAATPAAATRPAAGELSALRMPTFVEVVDDSGSVLSSAPPRGAARSTHDVAPVAVQVVREVRERETREARERDLLDVKKPVETIAIIPKSGSISAVQRRLFNTLLAHAQREREAGGEYFEAPLSIVTSDARFESNNTLYLKEQFRQMVSTLVEWNSPGEVWKACSLLSEASLEKRDGRVYLKWAYAPSIRSGLLRPDVYTRLSLAMTGIWRSHAASTLYEICTRYKSNPGGLTNRGPWVWWASVLCGRSEKDVMRNLEYKYFKRDTLRPALAEIRALQDEFEAELIEHRIGNRIDQLQFRVSERAQGSLAIGGSGQEAPGDLLDTNLLLRVMAVLKIEKTDAMAFFAAFDESQIRAALGHTESRMGNKKLEKLTSAVAYFKDALKKGYVKVERKDAGGKAKPAVRADDVMEKIRYAYEQDRRAQAEALFNEQAEDARADALRRFDEEFVPTMAEPLARSWRRDRLSSKMGATQFFVWLAKATWPETPSEPELVSFALERGLLKAA